MKMKWVASAMAAAVLSVAAMANAAVIKFESATGAVTVWTFNADGTASSDAGLSGTYTWDEEAKTICGQIEDAEVCATFEEVVNEAGFSTGYTTNTGDSGTATVVEPAAAPAE